MADEELQNEHNNRDNVFYLLLVVASWRVASSQCGVLTRSSSPASLVKRFRGGTRWESVFLPGLFKVMHHSLSPLHRRGQCLIHGFLFLKSWMLWLWKPLVSSSFLSVGASSLFSRHPNNTPTFFINHFPSSLPFLLFLRFLCLHSPPEHGLFPTPALVHTTYTGAISLPHVKHNTWKCLSPPPELLDHPELFTSTYLHHVLWPWWKCVYFQP